MQVSVLLLACASGIAALLLVAGCGTSSEKVIDSSTAKPAIEKQIQSSGAPAAKSISCPQTQAKAGKTFTCDVTLQDGTAYEMTIRIDKVGAQHPLLTVVGSKLMTVGPSNVKPLIDEQLRSTGAPAAKSIGCQHVAATVGNTFTCKATLVDGHVVTDTFRVLKVSATGAPPSFAIKTLSIK